MRCRKSASPAIVRGFFFFAEKFGGFKNGCIFETSNKPKNTVMKATQITTAETFGMINHEQGVMRAPAQSKELMSMLNDRKVGNTPNGEASTSELMKAWTKGWDKAKRAMMKEQFGF